MIAKKTTKTSTNEPSSKKARPKQEQAVSKPSALDAAAKVLGETKKALSTQELIEAMQTRGYWRSPKGKTPAATLYAALTREIKTKGKQACFQRPAPVISPWPKQGKDSHAHMRQLKRTGPKMGGLLSLLGHVLGFNRPFKGAKYTQTCHKADIT